MGKGTVTPADLDAARDLTGFVRECPSVFHTAAASCARLEEAGFTRLPEGAAWEISAGARCYVVRNNSSVVAFKVGEDAVSHDAGAAPLRFQIAASHGDSPTFKVKSRPDLEGPAGSLRLNVEAYGGMLDYTWFDRPLSVAGRVLARRRDRIESRLVSVGEPVAIVPSMAPHLDRGVNDGFAPNRARDLCPLFSAGALGPGGFDELVARAAGVRPDDVLARDLFLVNLQAPCVWGAAGEFVSAPRLDDLMCAFVSLRAFIGSENPACVTVWCCFDNEEVGSNTKQGAMSTLLPDVLRRVCAALGAGPGAWERALAASMLVSCDNAHAVHPNRPDRTDDANRVVLNGGIAVKEAANQHYCTDAFSRAVFVALCERAGVPCQTFANRSDIAGGSTLGNLSNIQASMHAVDVGCPQLAMHSAYETAGARDVLFAQRALEAFFRADIAIDGADAAEIR